MTEKIIEIKFDEFIPEIIKGLNRKEDSWVYRKLIKLFVPDFSDLEEYDEIFEVIAANPNTPIEILNILKKYDDEDVREAVVSNPNTPKSLLMEMLKDPSPYVRMGILKRDNIDVEFLELLSEDDGKDWLYSKSLEDDSKEEVLIGKLQEAIDDFEDEDSEDFDEDLSDSEYFGSFDDSDSDVELEMKILIASNPKTPAKILRKLSLEEDGDIRVEVAKNKKTSIAVLKKLSEDEDEEVRAAILLTQRKNIKIKLIIENHLEWINR